MDDLEEARRHLTLSFGRGTITLVDDTDIVQKVQFDLGPTGPDGNSMQLHDDLPVLYHFGFVANPPAGAQAVSLHTGGRRSDAVIIATAHQALRKTGLAPGDVAIHDSRGATVWLTAAGIVIDAAGGNVTVQNTGNISMTTNGDVDLTASSGTVTVKADHVTIQSDDVNLGDTGGARVALVGDAVAGGVITGPGATKVKAV